jgi:hypothetical protein
MGITLARNPLEPTFHSRVASCVHSPAARKRLSLSVARSDRVRGALATTQPSWAVHPDSALGRPQSPINHSNSLGSHLRLPRGRTGVVQGGGGPAWRPPWLRKRVEMPCCARGTLVMCLDGLQCWSGVSLKANSMATVSSRSCSRLPNCPPQQLSRFLLCYIHYTSASPHHPGGPQIPVMVTIWPSWQWSLTEHATVVCTGRRTAQRVKVYVGPSS